MKASFGIAALLVCAGLGFVSTDAAGEKVKLVGKDKVEGQCGESGGAYFPPNQQGVYGCVNPDGSGIVCGGSGSDAKSCDTFLKAPPQLPSRSALRKFQMQQAQVTPAKK